MQVRVRQVVLAPQSLGWRQSTQAQLAASKTLPAAQVARQAPLAQVWYPLAQAHSCPPPVLAAQTLPVPLQVTPQAPQLPLRLPFSQEPLQQMPSPENWAAQTEAEQSTDWPQLFVTVPQTPAQVTATVSGVQQAPLVALQTCPDVQQAPPQQASPAAQALPAVPQLASSVWKSVQRSLAPQSGVGVLQQVEPQVVSPATVHWHVPPAVQACPLGQVSPVAPHSQAPLVQVSLAGQVGPVPQMQAVPSHVSPAGQVAPPPQLQAPLVHVSLAGQVTPQAPQLVVAVLSTQLPEQQMPLPENWLVQALSVVTFV